MSKGMRVAVTGAGGFVGTNLVQLLLEQGHEVRGIDRVRPASAVGRKLSWVEADILDPAAMRKALGGVEVVYHLVAKITLAHEDPVAWRINTEGVRTVAEAALAAGVRRMVHCSSIHAFDQYRCGGRVDPSSPRSTDPSIPVYDRSKYAGERELHQVIAQGLDAVICNPAGVYGPVDYTHSRINALLLKAARGQVPVITEGGFDFVDVRDVARGLMLAAERGRCGENYLLGGHYVPMLELLRLAANAVGRKGPRFALPLRWLRAALPVLEPLSRRRGSDAISEAAIAAIECSPVMDYSKSVSELGYAPRPAAESVRDLIAFYVGSGELGRTAAPAAAPALAGQRA